MAGSAFVSAFGGGLGVGSSLADIFFEGKNRRKLGQLEQLFQSGDYNNAGAMLAGMGQVGQGVNTLNIPYEREQQALQRDFQNQQAEWQRQQAMGNNDYRERNFAADQEYRSWQMKKAEEEAAIRAAGGDNKYTSPVQGIDVNGNEVFVQPRSNGGFDVMEGITPSNPVKVINVGDEQVTINTRTGQELGRVRINNEGKAYNTERGKAEGKADAEFSANANEMLKQANGVVSLVDEALNSTGLDGAVGKWDSAKPQWMLSQDAINFNVRLNQLKGNAFLEAYESLKGGGPITDIEGKKAEAAKFRLDTAQSEEAMRAALGEMKTLMEARINEVTGKMTRLQDKDRARLNPTRRANPNAPAPIVNVVEDDDIKSLVDQYAD